MNVELNLNIDETIVEKTKHFAAQRKTSVSKLVEELLTKQIVENSAKIGKKGFVEKYAGTLSGKLSDKAVKKIKEEHLAKKYGY